MYTFYDLGIRNYFSNDKYVVVCFLMGNSQASEFYMATFRRRGITQKKAYIIRDKATV